MGDVLSRASEGRFELVVRGPITAQPAVLSQLRAALEAIEGVSVEASWT